MAIISMTTIITTFTNFQSRTKLSRQLVLERDSHEIGMELMLRRSSHRWTSSSLKKDGA